MVQAKDMTQNGKQGKMPMKNGEDQLSDFEKMMGDVADSVTTYTRKRPGVVAGAIFLFGFYLGWKIKPW